MRLDAETDLNDLTLERMAELDAAGCDWLLQH